MGTANGSLFTWESPGFSFGGTRMAGASLSKWPAAVMLAGLVSDGTLSFDDLASKHLPFWAKDPADTRSRVTLRHLLTFTSGYKLDGLGLFCKDFMGCAESLYQSMPRFLQKKQKNSFWISRSAGELVVFKKRLRKT